jgi:D-alanyl-D-alanine carboxypeptidase/D-alanyl-D-alanine-endopeptidase (penicillin-binding protein 4)
MIDLNNRPINNSAAGQVHVFSLIKIIGSGLRLYALILLLVLLVPTLSAWGKQKAEQFINNGGYIVHDNSRIFQYREHELFIPASTLKILTSLVALEKLGKAYRFETHFFLDQQNNLYIKGYGDPFLTSEVILAIGRTLTGLGIRQIRAIFLDDSSFALNGETAGEENSANPYDAPNGALVVNFNALPVQVAGDATITSGEPQTPLLPLMKEAGHQLSPGRHRINVDTLAQPGQLSPALRYAGELFVVQFRKAGINIETGYGRKLIPVGLPSLLVHYSSKSLEEIIRACLKNSNNFIANQLFLSCGIRDYGLPATWDKSRRVVAIYAEKILQLKPDQLTVREGSGLSRKNRASPAALLRILDFFKPYSALLNKKNSALVKSGTMKDVYCYAGYFPQNDRLLPFVILLNQRKNNRDRVLQILHGQLETKEKLKKQTNQLK